MKQSELTAAKKIWHGILLAWMHSLGIVKCEWPGCKNPSFGPAPAHRVKQRFIRDWAEYRLAVMLCQPHHFFIEHGGRDPQKGGRVRRGTHKRMSRYVMLFLRNRAVPDIELGVIENGRNGIDAGSQKGTKPKKTVWPNRTFQRGGSAGRKDISGNQWPTSRNTAIRPGRGGRGRNDDLDTRSGMPNGGDIMQEIIDGFRRSATKGRDKGKCERKVSEFQARGHEAHIKTDAAGVHYVYVKDEKTQDTPAPVEGKNCLYCANWFEPTFDGQEHCSAVCYEQDGGGFG